MKNTVNSMYVQIAYMVLTGVGLVFMPNTVLSVLGMQPVDDVWIKVLGLLALVLSYYYWVMTRNQVVSFIRASIWGRYAFCAGLIAFVLLNQSEKALLLLVVPEAALATWTMLSLPKDVKL